MVFVQKPLQWTPIPVFQVRQIRRRHQRLSKDPAKNTLEQVLLRVPYFPQVEEGGF